MTLVVSLEQAILSLKMSAAYTAGRNLTRNNARSVSGLRMVPAIAIRGGLAGDRVNEWDMGKVSWELTDLLPKLERMANQPSPTGEQMREHIMKQSREDIKRLWKD
jgi:hypothetical protein